MELTYDFAVLGVLSQATPRSPAELVRYVELPAVVIANILEPMARAGDFVREPQPGRYVITDLGSKVIADLEQWEPPRRTAPEARS